jgi:hypothetical protein
MSVYSLIYHPVYVDVVCHVSVTPHGYIVLLNYSVIDHGLYYLLDHSSWIILLYLLDHLSMIILWFTRSFPIAYRIILLSMLARY